MDKTKENIHYHDGDMLLYNTLADKCMPSEFVGKYHIHILCHAGRAQFKMAEKTHEIRANDLVIWQIGSDISEALYSPDFDADFLLVSRIFLMENNPENVWATKAFVYIKANPVFHLDEKGMASCRTDFSRFKEYLADEEHIFRREILGRQMQIFLFNMYNIYAAEINRIQQTTNVKAGIFNRFMDLARQFAIENREVAFYADKLCVTPKYLSEVSRKSSGKPASEWINGFATQEAVAMLKNPDLSLTEIAYRMNFYSQSHFCRYIKQALGVSPTEYRRKMQKEKK